VRADVQGNGWEENLRKKGQGFSTTYTIQPQVLANASLMLSISGLESAFYLLQERITRTKCRKCQDVWHCKLFRGGAAGNFDRRKAVPRPPPRVFPGFHRLTWSFWAWRTPSYILTAQLGLPSRVYRRAPAEDTLKATEKENERPKIRNGRTHGGNALVSIVCGDDTPPSLLAIALQSAHIP